MAAADLSRLCHRASGCNPYEAWLLPKTVFITGTNSGFGKATVERFAGLVGKWPLRCEALNSIATYSKHCPT